MDSIIPLGQNNTLAEYMILSDADNRPPMLDKDLTKKYVELSVVEKIQADCDMKAINIILQGFDVLVFSPRDDLIAYLTKGRQEQSYYGTGYKSNATISRENNASGCKGGHLRKYILKPSTLYLDFIEIIIHNASLDHPCCGALPSCEIVTLGPHTHTFLECNSIHQSYGSSVVGLSAVTCVIDNDFKV
nr:hypothetical protein [Tanacetum cinerariifolium]